VNATAADYPERAIEVLVPFGAGGGSDYGGAGGGGRMKPQLKNGVLVNNMPGGGATKGMLYISSSRLTGTAFCRHHLPSHRCGQAQDAGNILRDFDPLCRIQWDTSAVTISGDSQFKTLADLVEWGRKTPKGLKFAGTSPGGWSEIQTVAFFKKCGWR
jgi:tripartite-type tricarboxylate transporter receptor subunit TctC